MPLEIELKHSVRSARTSYAAVSPLSGCQLSAQLHYQKKLVHSYQEQNYLVITCNEFNSIKNILQITPYRMIQTLIVH